MMDTTIRRKDTGYYATNVEELVGILRGGI